MEEKSMERKQIFLSKVWDNNYKSNLSASHYFINFLLLNFFQKILKFSLKMVIDKF